MGLTVAHSGGNGNSADRKARALRRAALVGGASALALTVAGPAFAQDGGGNGGQSQKAIADGVQNGGTGGASPNGQAGEDGGTYNDGFNDYGSGGGGGGAGTTGGAGGDGGAGGALGGAGGTPTSKDGQDGARLLSNGSRGGAGGGGGGAHGGSYVNVSVAFSAGDVSIGGDGGDGGDLLNYFNTLYGGAGGGGAGGYGVSFTANNASLTNNGATFTGGYGGEGGAGDNGGSGDGGDGGIGAAFSGTGNTFINSGTVTGGNGGAGGDTAGTELDGIAGLGGAGVFGSDLTVINSGWISGGASGDGATRANAVTFGAGANVFEHRAGGRVTGNVVGDGDDLFRLGGDNGFNTFDLALIGSTYQGFGQFEKTGNSTFTLGGTTTQVTPWTISDGELEILSAGALGDESGLLTFNNPDTALEFTAVLRSYDNLNTSRDIRFLGNGAIEMTSGTSAFLSGTFTGGGRFIMTGAGRVVLSGDGSGRTGTTYLDEGTLGIGRSNALGSGDLIVDTGTTLSLSNAVSIANNVLLSNDPSSASPTAIFNQTSGTASIAGAINGGSANIAKTGSGNLTFSGANTYQGTTTVAEGTLTLTTNSALGTTDGGTIVQDGATLAFNAPVLNIADAISITGTGASGAGALRLQNGDTSLNGLVTLTGDSRVVVNEGGINFRGGVTGDYDLTLNGLNNLQRVVAFSSDLDIGDNDLIADNITVAFYAGNSFTGDVRINSSTLELAAGGASTIDDNARLTMTASGRFVRLTLYQDETIGSLAGGSGFISAGNGDRVLTLGGDNTSTSFGGEFITGGGTLSVVKTGTGTMTLSRASNFQNNPFLGGFTIAGGTLAISADRILGADSAALTFDGTGATLRTLTDLSSARNIALTSGGIFETDADTTATFSGVVSGNGSLTKTGTGTLVLTGANTYTGGTSLDAGTIRIGSDNALGTNGLTAANGTALDFADGISVRNNIVPNGNLTLNQSGGSASHSGAITGPGGITKTGDGALTLAGIQTYDGVTTVSAGTLIATSDFSLGSTVGNTIVANGATLDLQGITTSEAITISGTGVNGAGALRNSNRYARLNGRVTLAADATIASGPSALELRGGIDGNHDLTIDAASIVDIMSDLAIDGDLTIDGTGIVVLQRDNSFTGNVTVNGGRLDSGADDGSVYNTIGDTAALTLGTGTSWRLSQSGETIGSLSGSGDVYIDGFLTGGRIARLTVGGNNVSTTFGGRLREQNIGVLSLTKTGTGTLTLTGDNTYSGGTVLDRGTLSLGTSTALGTGTVQAASDTSLLLADGINVANAIELTGDASGNVAFGGGSGEATLSGVISGAAAIVKVDPGTLVLTGRNTYSGGTQIFDGTLAINSDDALGDEGGAIRITGPNGTLRTTADLTIFHDIVLDAAGTISTDANTSALIYGYVSGAGGLTKTGAGTLNLLEGNTYGGDTFLTEGTLGLQGDDALNSGRLFASDATTITYGRNYNIANAVEISGTVRVNMNFGTATQSGVVSGAGGLTKTGFGDLQLSGANTYSGGTTLSQGGLILGNNSALGTGTLTAADGTLLSFGNNLRITSAMTLNGQVSFDQEGGTAELRNAISGTGGLTKTGSGELSISGANDYTGETLVSAGSLRLVSAGTLGTTDGGVRVLDGASLTLDATTLTEGVTISGAGLGGTGALRATRISSTMSGPIALADAATIGSEVSGFRITGGISGDHDLAIAGGGNTIIEGGLNIGTGVLTKNSTGNLTLGGDSTFAGGTLLNAGRLFVLSDRALGTGSLTAADGTRLTFNNPANLANDVTLNGNLGVGTYFSGGTLSGVISGSGSLTKELSGTLTLSGANTYEGGTFLTSGGLRLANDGALGSGSLTASDSTLIEYADGVSIGNAIALNGVVELSPTTGTSEQTGLISGDGTLNKVGTGLLLLDGANTYTGGTRISGGALAIGSDASLGAASSALSFSGFNNATLQLRGDWDTTRAININAPSAKIDNFGFDADIAGTITGGGVLALFGSGTVTLSGTNTHSGGTYLYGGKLAVTNSSSVGTGDMFANNATTISLANAVGLDNDLEFTGNIVLDQSAGEASFAGRITQFDTGSLTKTGAGNLLLSGASTYYGNTVVAEGTLTATSASALGSTDGATIVRDGASLALNGTFDLAESLHLAGAGVQGLGALQQRGGQVGIDGSITLDAASTIASYSGTLTLNGGVSGAHDLAIGGDVNIASGVQIGAGTLTMNAGATLTLTGTNTYTGGTVLNAGTVVIGNDSAFGTGTVTARNATIGFGATDIALSNAIDLQGGLTLDIGDTDAEVDGSISGAGMFLIMGSGTMQLSGANTYSGNTGLVDARLTLANDSALGTSTLLAGAGSTVDYADGVTIGNLVGLTGGVFMNQGLGSATQSGLIEGADSSLTKTGTGILTLTGANTYTGATDIQGGTLLVNGDQSAAIGLTSVFGGATLGGKGIIGGDVTLADGASLNPGTSPGTLTINGNLALSGGSILNVEFGEAGVAGGALNDLVNVGGDLTLDGTLNVTTSAGGTFGAGVYRVFNYGGTLTDNGLDLGTTPTDSVFVQTSVANQVNLINTAGLTFGFWDGAAGSNNDAIDGGDGIWQSRSGNANWTGANGAINGAYDDGTFAIFQGAAGNVSIDTSLGDVTASGLQFVTNGYVIDGDTLTLTGGAQSTIRVGDGTAGGAGVTATISADIAGATQLVKTDLGTLVLSGDNTYTGGTSLANGTLVLGSSDALGTGTLSAADGTQIEYRSLTGIVSIANAIELTGAVDFTVDGSDSFQNGRISGAGSLQKLGFGYLNLTGFNTYSGGTTIGNGTLAIESDESLGAASGALSFAGGQTTLRLRGAWGTSRTIALNGTQAIIDNFGWNADISGTISGTGALRLDGAGTVTLSGRNTYQGGTTLRGGTLSLENNAALGTGSLATAGGTAVSLADGVTVANAVQLGGATTVDSAGASALSGQISGTGSLLKTGTGTLTLSGANSYSGGTVLSQGALALDSANALGGGALGAAGGTTVVYGDGVTIDNAVDLTGAVSFDQTGGSATQRGVVTGSGSLTKNGTGTFTLSGNNTYAGTTTVAGGTLKVTSNTALGSTAGDTIVQNGATLALAGLFGLNVQENITLAGSGVGGSGALRADGGINSVGGRLILTDATTIASNSALSLEGGITGDFDLTIAGRTTLIRSDLAIGTHSLIVDAGLVSLESANSFTGDVIVKSGTLQLGAGDGDSTIGDTARLTVNAGATVDLAQAAETIGSLTGSGQVTSYGGDRRLTVGGDNSSTFSGTLTQQDNASLALTKIGSGTFTLTGENSYTGGTSLDAGTLVIGSDDALGTGALNAADGTGIGFIGDRTVGNSIALGGAVTFDTDANSITQSGSISGAGTLAKTGTGTLTLTGTNTHTGGTNVLAGTLLVNGDQSAATGPTSVFGGATLGGRGTIGGDVTLADGASLNPGTSPGTLTIDGNLALSGGSILNFEFGEAGVAGGSLNDLVNVGGDLTLDGTLNVSQSAGGTFGAGVYRVFNYGGTLTDNGLALGSTPAGNLYVQTSVANQINLINATGLTFGFWDGAAGANNDAIDGGNGIWQNSTGNANWTSANGAFNGGYEDGTFAIFQGAAGTVTIDTSLGDVTASGMQFVTNGYGVDGDTLTLTGGAQSIIRVGDGTATGAGVTATIAADIAGETQLVKTDLGTLVLSGDNSFTGGASVADGVLVLGSDTALGTGALSAADGTGIGFIGDRTIGNAVALDGTVTFDTDTNRVVQNGVISGSGTLVKVGSGTLSLTSDNTYAGTIDVQAGALVNSGTVAAVINRAAFTNTGTAGDVANAGTLSLAGQLSSLTQTAGSTGVTGDASVTGEVALQAGTLTIDTARLDIGGTLANGASVSIGTGGILDADTIINANAGSIVNAGTIDAATGIANQAGATLDSTGTLGALVANEGTLSARGILAGRLSNAAVGQFTLTGNLASNGSAIDNLDVAVLAVTGGNLTGVGTLTNTSLGGDGAGANAGVVIAGTRTLEAGMVLNSGDVIVQGTLAAPVQQTGGLMINTGTVTGDVAANGGAIIGTGSFGGDLTAYTGATIGAGTLGGAGTLNIDGTLGVAGTVAYDLGTADVIGGSTNDLMTVGSAVIDGATFDLNNAAAGTYRLINAADAQAIALGNAALANAAAGSRIYTTGDGQFLNVQVGTIATQYWDGSANAGNGAVDGGSGVWSNALGRTNWTGATGALNNSWQGTANPPVNAVFGGTAGTVSVDTGAGYLGFGALQFESAGYALVDAAGDDAPDLGANGTTANAFAGIASSQGDIASTITVTDPATTARIEAGIGGVSAATGLILDGAGTLELAGNNEALTGTIAVLGGTLRVSGGSAISNASALVLRNSAAFELASDEAIGSLDGSVAATVDLGGNMLIAGGNGDDTSFAGVISGTGDFVKIGAGTLTLMGGNTYTGATGVIGGTLRLGASDVLSDQTFVTVRDATLDIGAHTDTAGVLQIEDGTLAGAGTLTAAEYQLSSAQVDANLGAGTLFQLEGTSILDGTSAADIVAIEDGTLRIGADERLADSASMQIAQNAAFDLAGASETIGALYGLGAVSLGEGMLTLGGPGVDFGFGGAISGSGTLRKTGAGTFTLIGDQTMTGLMDVQGGTLAYFGNSAGGALVSGGTLAGNASFAQTLSMTGGTIAPGYADQPIGIIAAQSIDLTGGTVLFDFTSSATALTTDLLLASGAVTISGTQVGVATADPVGSFLGPQRAIIVQGDSLTGTFANGQTFETVGNRDDLFWRLRYDLAPNAVALEVRQVFDFSLGFGARGTPNQRSVATNLSNGQLEIGDAFSDVVRSLGLMSTEDRLQAFDNLSGENLASATTGGFIESQRFADLLTQRMNASALLKTRTEQPQEVRSIVPIDANYSNALDAPDVATIGMWMQAFGGASRIDGDVNTYELSGDASGIAGGLEARYSTFKAGVAVAWSDSAYDVRSLEASMQGESLHIGGYLGYEGEAAFAGLFGSYQESDLDSLRNIRLTGQQPRSAAAEIDMTGRTFGGFAGYRAKLGGGLTLTPLIGVTNIRIERDAFSEQGAGPLSLQVAAETREVTTGTAQLRLSTEVPMASGTFAPYLAGGVERYWGDLNARTDMRFAGAVAGMDSFTIIGAPLEETVGVIGAGFDVRPSDGFEVGASAGARVGDRVSQSTVEVHARIRF